MTTCGRSSTLTNICAFWRGWWRPRHRKHQHLPQLVLHLSTVCPESIHHGKNALGRTLEMHCAACISFSMQGEQLGFSVLLKDMLKCTRETAAGDQTTNPATDTWPALPPAHRITSFVNLIDFQKANKIKNKTIHYEKSSDYGASRSPLHVSCLPLLLIMAKTDKHKTKSIFLHVVKSVCDPLLSHYSFYGPQIYLETHFFPHNRGGTL